MESSKQNSSISDFGSIGKVPRFKVFKKKGGVIESQKYTLLLFLKPFSVAVGSRKIETFLV
jgi:hypothetical protein